MRLEYYGVSDTGSVRNINQDAFCMYQKGDTGLFAAADGMGGYADGEKASRIVIDELSKWWDSFAPDICAGDFKNMVYDAEQAVAAANRRIYTQLNRSGVCGTTVTALLIYQSYCGIIYAGDSRCYMSCGRVYKVLTVDEVWENQPGIQKEELGIKNHPNRGKLTNAVGVRENVCCRMLTDEIRPDTTFLICSDGLYKYCEDRYIKKCLKHAKDARSVKKAVHSLLDRAYKNGAGDNITMIIVAVNQP